MLLAAPARAQSADVTTPTAVGWGAIDGSVRDTSGEWLRGVEIVSVDNAAIRTRSGAGGAFRLDSMSAGPHLIRFRRIGVLPLTVSVVVDPNAITSVDAVVEPFPLTLSRVTIQASSGELVNLPPGVADRMRTGIGKYITGAEIEKMHVLDTKDIFRRVAGVSVEQFAGSYVVRSTRGPQTINGDGCAGGMAVVLDGAVLHTTADKVLGNQLAGVTGAMDGVSPRDIGAIEIYKAGAEVPAGLMDSECGTVYIWTK
jgi:hypothetical protein